MPGKGKNRENSRIYAYILLICIIILLIVLLAVVGKIRERKVEISEYQAEKPVIVPDVEPEKAPETKNSLIIVIDDVGNSVKHLERFLEFPGKITFAVMPCCVYTDESVRLILEGGKDIILHQPMEPLGNENPGEGAIYVGMDENRIFEILHDNFRQVFPAHGMNNHMGSKVTGDEATMHTVIKFLEKNGFFFLDSVTTPNTPVGERIAEDLGIPYVKRNMFLDNDKNREAILTQLRESMNISRKYGRAIMIGHVMTTELAELLIELYPQILEEGFEFESVSDLIKMEF